MFKLDNDITLLLVCCITLLNHESNETMHQETKIMPTKLGVNLKHEFS